jgi:hypothetical protein
MDGLAKGMSEDVASTPAFQIEASRLGTARS